MPQLADYKILRENAATLDSVGESVAIDFTLPPGALLVDGAQRPFFTFNISVRGAMPQTVSMELNGVSINTHTYEIDAPKATRTVVVDGSTFSADSNELTFTLTSGAGAGLWTVVVSDVIVHFQQEVGSGLGGLPKPGELGHGPVPDPDGDG